VFELPSGHVVDVGEPRLESRGAFSPQARESDRSAEDEPQGEKEERAEHDQEGKATTYPDDTIHPGACDNREGRAHGQRHDQKAYDDVT